MKLLLITLSLCCAAPLSAAEAKPVAWHENNAQLRLPVKVNMKDALLRMPPQVYIADLKPVGITGGLAFDLSLIHI